MGIPFNPGGGGMTDGSGGITERKASDWEAETWLNSKVKKFQFTVRRYEDVIQNNPDAGQARIQGNPPTQREEAAENQRGIGKSRKVTMGKAAKAVHRLPLIVSTKHPDVEATAKARQDNFVDPKNVSKALSEIKAAANKGAPGYKNATEEDRKLYESYTNQSGFIYQAVKSMEEFIRRKLWFKTIPKESVGPKVLPGLTLEQSIALRQKNAQCALIYNFDTLVHAHGLKKDFPTSNMVMHYTGPPEDLPTKITNPFNAKDFVNASTDQIAYLVPKLEFYIRETNEAGKPKDHRVIFSDYVDAGRMIELRDLRNNNSVAEMLKASGFQGTNVGITDFSWKYENKDWGDYVVGATLSMHFGSMADLVNETYLDFIFTSGLRHGTDTIRRNKNGEIAARAARKKRLKKEINEIYKKLQQAAKGGSIASPDKEEVSATFKQLKVVVGWQKPTGEDVDTKMSKGFLRAIEESQKTLLLNLVTYDLTFEEQGQVNLTLEYVASIDNFSLRDTSDVLAGRAVPPRGKKQGFVDPQTLPVPIFTSTKVENLLSTSREQRFKDKVHPRGYIAARIKRKLANDSMLCAADGVRMELEWLQRKIELVQTDSPPKKSQTTVPSSVKNLQKYITTAQQVYDEIQDTILSRKYQSFMDSLIYSGKVFKVFSNIIDMDQQKGKPRFKEVVTAGEITPKGADALSNRISTAAKSLKRKGKDLSISEYVAKSHALDPRSDRKFENTHTLDPNKASRVLVVPLYYIRLADIIEIALKNSNAPIRKDFRVILGSFNTASAAFPNTYQRNQPLGEIPISIDYFGQWFFENIIATETRTLKFRKFMELLCWDLINPLLSNLCDEDSRTKLNMDFTQVTASPPKQFRLKTVTDPSKGEGKKLVDKMNKNMVIGDPAETKDKVVPQIPVVMLGPAHLNAIFKNGVKNAKLQNSHLESFFIFYAKDMAKPRNGNVKNDSKDGIYHLYVGADAGLAKRFNFSTKNLSMIREMNIERANTTTRGADVLVLPQDVSIEMVGNTLFQNGSMVYVNAEMGIGTAVADMLSLGGYYRVYRVSNEIAPGRFTTTLDCYFEMPRVFAPGSKPVSS